MLQVENLTISHRRDLRILIENLSFVLNPGDKLAVIGEEGNGKSSLLKVLSSPARVPDYMEVKGRIAAHGAVGYLPQFVADDDLDKSVYDYIADTQTADWQAINEAAINVRLSPETLYDTRPVKSFSGGEKTKIQLARLLLSNPAVLLLDEPSNDLDIETLQWLETFIQNETRPILFVSHDETLVRRSANGILHLELLHRRQTPVWTLARTSLDSYLQTRSDQFERQARLAESERRAHAEKMERYRRIEQKVEHQQRTISRGDPAGGRLLKKKMHAVKSLERRIEREHEARTRKPDREDAIMLYADPDVGHHEDKEILAFRLDRLAVPDGMNGFRELARDIELTVRGRDKIAIIGRNGSGKSTLLKKLRDELSLRPDLRVAYMPQNYADEMDETVFPADFLAPSGLAADRQRALDFLGCMKFERHEMHRRIGDLSGGQKAKLFLLRFILQQNDVWLLDEPTRNFSPLSAPVIRDVLRAFNGTVIAVSHDRIFLRDVAETVYELTEGGLVERFDP